MFSARGSGLRTQGVAVLRMVPSPQPALLVNGLGEEVMRRFRAKAVKAHVPALPFSSPDISMVTMQKHLQGGRATKAARTPGLHPGE